MLVSLSACYHPDIQQGNDLATVNNTQVKVGMSKEDVIALLGEPVLQPTFSENQLLYVYTDYPNHGTMTEKKLILTFDNKGKVTKIERN